jgi:hypothetical protein
MLKQSVAALLLDVRSPDRKPGDTVGRVSNALSLSLLHDYALSSLTRIDEADAKSVFETVPNGLVNFPPARVSRLGVVCFDANDRPPRDANNVGKLRLIEAQQSTSSPDHSRAWDVLV